MTCREFRENDGVRTKPARVDDDTRDTWNEHLDSCDECGDWYRAERVRDRGVDPSKYACVHLAYRVTFQCEQHENDPWECADYVIVYVPKFDEYGIPIRDGGRSKIDIANCPWCGITLPRSKREEWVEELEKLGYMDPWSDELPDEFQTDRWWRRRMNE